MYCCLVSKIKSCIFLIAAVLLAKKELHFLVCSCIVSKEKSCILLVADEHSHKLEGRQDSDGARAQPVGERVRMEGCLERQVSDVMRQGWV